MKRALAIFIGGLAALAMPAGVAGRAAATTMEQAVAQCKERVSPIVRACVREKMMANREQESEVIYRGLPGAGCRPGQGLRR